MLHDSQISALVDFLFAWNLLGELKHTANASERAWEFELFAFKSSATTTGEGSIKASGIVFRVQHSKVLFELTTLWNTDSAVGRLVRLQSFPLQVVSWACLCHVMKVTSFSSTARSLVCVTFIFRQSTSGFDQMNFLQFAKQKVVRTCLVLFGLV